MSTKLKVTVITFSLAILLFTLAGGFVNVSASSNDGAYRQLSVYSEVLSRIRLEYVEEPNIAGVTDGALHGLPRVARRQLQLPVSGRVQALQSSDEK